MKCFIAHDVGTSGVKSILIDIQGDIRGHAIEAYPLQRPRPGWVEQRPEDYWNAVCRSSRKLISDSRVDIHDIAGIAFTTQAMGIIPVSSDGRILHPNISWVDGRAEDEAIKLMKKFLGRRIFKAIVGIEITGKDVIPKLMWIRDHLPEIYRRTDKFLDVNGYLKFMSTGRKVAEWSGACSYAFNLKKKDWERIFFRIAGLDLDKLPELVRSTDAVGGLTPAAAESMGLAPGIPVYGGCDDTQSAVVGSGAIGEGEAHIYLGTAAQVTVSTKRDVKFRHGAVCLQNADPDMNLVVGVTEAAGVNVEWLIDQFYAEEKASDGAARAFECFEEEIAGVPAGSDHLVFTPWFLGERCPVSSTTTRSTIFNLSHDHSRAHMARAHCEGIGYNVRWILENFERDFGFRVASLRIIGGGSSNDAWMQIIADVTRRTVQRTNHPRHAGAIGGAMCAMVGSGAFEGFHRIHDLVHATETFEPNPAHFRIYDELYAVYQNLYKALRKPYISANLERFSR